MLGHVGTAFVWVVACGCIVSGGMPGFGAFVGEFLVAAFTVWGKLGVLILFAAVLHGVAGMRLVQRIVWGQAATGRTFAEDALAGSHVARAAFTLRFCLGFFNRGRCSTGSAGAVDEALAIVVVNEPAREQSTWSAPGRAHRYLRKVYWLR